MSYADLLRIFWESHDPTQGMRQGNDVGTTYRSAIYTFSDEQHVLATSAQGRLRVGLEGGRPRRCHHRDRIGAGILFRGSRTPAISGQESRRLLRPPGHGRHLSRSRAGCLKPDFSGRSRFQMNFCPTPCKTCSQAGPWPVGRSARPQTFFRPKKEDETITDRVVDHIEPSHHYGALLAATRIYRAGIGPRTRSGRASSSIWAASSTSPSTRPPIRAQSCSSTKPASSMSSSRSRTEAQREQALRRFRRGWPQPRSSMAGFSPGHRLSSRSAQDYPEIVLHHHDMFVDQPNVTPRSSSREQEGSYLVGMLAGMKSESRHRWASSGAHGNPAHRASSNAAMVGRRHGGR